jgi:hypothetical protein
MPKVKRPTPKAKAAKRPKRSEYDRYKAGQAAISRRRSAEGREIGPLPKVANPRRKKRCERSLRRYCETYRRETFYLAWSDDHLKAIAKLEAAVLGGGLFAWAQPRGSGKTALTEAAAEWALLYGHRRFVALIGATEEAAEEMLDSIKIELETNELLAEDFPEVCFPITSLGGLTNRGPGQTLGGERTRITWGSKEVVLPTVKGSKASGGRLRVAGITGRVRGMKFKDATGKAVRPDLAIGDDPQTDESAKSPVQTDHRERVLMGAVKGMAGPGKSIALVVPCTVIARGDLADRILDRDRRPQFQGERFRMLLSPPSNADLWERYAELRRESLRNDGNGSEATAFYVANRGAMDAGAAVSWAERFDPKTEASAIQAAMNLKIDDPASFAAEYQNEPLAAETRAVNDLTAVALGRKANRVPRGTVPRECTRLTAFVDVGRVLWWAACGWDERFGGAAVDWGVWPNQGRSYFTNADARHTLATTYPGMSEEAQVYQALADLTAAVVGREWPHQESGGVLRVERVLIDSGWHADTVYQFCRKSPHAHLLLPSKGHVVGPTGTPIDGWAARPQERRGPSWRLSAPDAKSGRLVVFDPNYWKTFVADRLHTPPAAGGCLWVNGTAAGDHDLLFDHLTCEFRTRVQVGKTGREYDQWAKRPGRSDNHWFDAAVGCAVAASVLGLTFRPDGSAATPRPRLKMSEIQARKRAAQGG